MYFLLVSLGAVAAKWGGACGDTRPGVPSQSLSTGTAEHLAAQASEPAILQQQDSWYAQPQGTPHTPTQATTPDCPLGLAGFRHELEGMDGESAPQYKVARTHLQVQTGKLRPGEALEFVQVPKEVTLSDTMSGMCFPCVTPMSSTFTPTTSPLTSLVLSFLQPLTQVLP